MSAAQVVAMARTRGVKLSYRDGRLWYEAPAGRLTPELRAALVNHKAAVLDILEGEYLAARQLVTCYTCAHYIASPSRGRIDLSKGWEAGAKDIKAWSRLADCTQGCTPRSFPFTAWYCDTWAEKGGR